MIDLQYERHKAGLTQKQLAQKIGVRRTTIAMIENGTNTPSIATAKALAEALNLNWAEFYDDTGGEDSVTDSARGGETVKS